MSSIPPLGCVESTRWGFYRLIGHCTDVLTCYFQFCRQTLAGRRSARRTLALLRRVTLAGANAGAGYGDPRDLVTQQGIGPPSPHCPAHRERTCACATVFSV